MSRDDREQPDKIQAFDALFTTNHIQMYKILLPYLEASLQKQLAVYIKYMEFQYTLTYFSFGEDNDSAPDIMQMFQMFHK